VIYTTYAKEDLLNIFKAQEQSGSFRDLKDLLLGDLGTSNGGGWGRSGDEAGGAEVCWDKEGGLKPVSLEEMAEEEREVRGVVLLPFPPDFRSQTISVIGNDCGGNFEI
jgi:PERQ amino acid-rich with GYF domain-containing protein